MAFTSHPHMSSGSYSNSSVSLSNFEEYSSASMMNAKDSSNTSSRSTSASANGLRLQLSNGGYERRSAFAVSELDSQSITWTPFFEDAQNQDYMSKDLDINTFSAFESLHMDDFLINDAGSSSSSAASEMGRNPSSSLHNLPAWSSCEEDDGFFKASPTDSDNVEENNDIWFAPTANLSRKKRLNFGRTVMPEEREVSPGAAAANLKSHKSAPQLVRRLPSADHKTKLEELLVEMGWPKDTSLSTAEASDGLESQGNFNSHSNSNSGGGQTNFSGSGSLASGMPTTSALFERRANMREGNLPAPSAVTIARPNEEQDSASLLAAADQSIGQVTQSRSATFPSAHETSHSIDFRQGPSTISGYSSSFNSYMGPSQYFTGQNDTEKASKAVEAALLYGMESRRDSYNQQHQSNRSPNNKLPDTPSTGTNSTTELRTPITPFQALTTSDINGVSFEYQVPSAQMLPGGFQGAHYPMKMKSHQDLSNSLGLHGLTNRNNNAQYQPAMIDSSAFAQIFAHMPSSTDPSLTTSITNNAVQQMPPNLKQMRSSPNMRTSPSNESSSSSSTKSPLRKIASNRRLTVSNSNENTFVLSSPNPKSPSKKGKSPKFGSEMVIPPLPTSSSVQLQPTSSRSTGSFQFVNYGVQDADELCSAVAPSGSYKIPLKGFAGGQDGDDDQEGDDDEDEPKVGNRSRSKSANNRLGPRWQGMDEEQGGNEQTQDWNETVGDKKSRQVKRRKSEASMTGLLARRKTASSGNLRRRD